MKKTIPTMQRRRILFLISLPQTPEFEKDKEDVQECLTELRALQVDVREHIERDDLSNANSYDIVIVVAHHDSKNDVLVLANGTMKMTDFVNSLPADFNGVLDFSSCYSATAYQAVKTRCSQCRVQAALVEVRLLQRMIMYPSLVEYLYKDTDIDYHDAYKEVSIAFNEFAESKGKGFDESEMTQLGQQMSSVYAPSEVKRNCPFQIIVFFHYDSEKEVIRVKAQRWQSNAIIRDDFEIPIELREKDRIAVTISFDSPDNVNIVEKDGEYTKYIVVKKEMTVEKFKVMVLPEFKGNGFLTNIEMSKDDVSFLKCAFNVDVVEHENKAPAEVVAEVPQNPEKPEELINRYTKEFTGKIFEFRNVTQFKNILKKRVNDEERLFFIRKFLYNNNLFIKQLTLFLQEKESELSNLLRYDAKSSEITFELVPILKKYNLKLQKKLGTLEGKFLKVKEVKRDAINFVDSVMSFSPIEWAFLDLSSEIKNFDYQIDMLKVFRELRDEIKDECKKGTINKDEIKDLATQFLEHPHHNHVDQIIYDIFKTSGTGSIIHTKSQGATMPFLALVLSMVEKEYVSSDNRKDKWFINVEKYIDFSKNNKSLRTPKSRINKLVSLLDNKEVREKIKNYQKTEAGRISITAYYLLKMRVSIV